MNITKFLHELGKIMELDDDKMLSGSEQLAEMEEWDSLAVLGFIAMADKQLGKTLNGDKIMQCKTVDDLWALVAGQENV